MLADQFHGRDSGQPDQLGANDVLGGLAQGIQVFYLRVIEGGHHHRPGIGVVLADRYFRGIGSLRLVGHRFLQIQEGLVHIDLPVVFDRNQGASGPGDGFYIFNAAAAGGGGLQGSDELPLHFLGWALSPLYLDE